MSTVNHHTPCFDVFYHINNPVTNTNFSVSHSYIEQIRPQANVILKWKTTLCQKPDSNILSVVDVKVELDDNGHYHVWIPYNITKIARALRAI